MSATRIRLAKRLEEAFLKQHGLELVCDPATITFPRGFYRTDIRADTYRWEATCTKPGERVGQHVECYDTATICARRGITLDRMPYNRGWEATALATPPAVMGAKPMGDI